ncbi:MAG: protoheme IX farnesyltransferase, partial [Actinomycetota bacterium]|nr:protoheme IX farnesyltransferase [Actinomycetota bacterium]
AGTLVLAPVASLSWIYTVVASLLGAVFVALTVVLVRRPTAAMSMRVFTYSITYVTLLFGAIVVDVFVRHGVS